MNIFILVALTMTAFAANSVLTKVGVATFGMDPMIFSIIRTAAGAATLTGMVVMRGQGRIVLGSPKRWAGGLALALYMVGFSWAYLTLDAGLGALILFGILQVVMFGWAVVEGQRIPLIRWVGAAVAMVGLAVLLWPGGDAAVPLAGSIAMILAGVSWGAYTLLGRGEPDALASSAGNFIICVPIVLLGLFFAENMALSLPGLIIAIVAGGVTSGMGYALWYRCLPQLPTVTASVAQLSVPVIAVAAGVVLLSEPLTSRLVIAGVLVLGGIAISLKPQR